MSLTKRHRYDVQESPYMIKIYSSRVDPRPRRKRSRGRGVRDPGPRQPRRKRPRVEPEASEGTYHVFAFVMGEWWPSLSGDIRDVKFRQHSVPTRLPTHHV